jgi:hypothetical protein
VILETQTPKKSRFSLSDYDYQRDISLRLEMARFSAADFALLEELLYSPLVTSVKKIAKTLGLETVDLTKFVKMGLLTLSGDMVNIDKTSRRYFETEKEKFDPDFKPGMEFLQDLLKKVPIHILPVWYALPRTANNIFESIVEKFLQTPQLFARHLLDLNTPHPVVTALAHDVLHSPRLMITAKSALKKYNISEEELEEHLLFLEFHFVCCASYIQEKGKWEKIITPFHEWKEYLTFLSETSPKTQIDPSKVVRTRPHDFSFVEDLSAILQGKGSFEKAYGAHLKEKIKTLQLVGKEASEWLEMRLENRALYIYRHPHNKIHSMQLPSALLTEKAIRDAEKSILRVLHKGWVLFEEFIKGVITPIGDHIPVMLKESCKRWKYVTPTYSTEEQNLLYGVIFESLFEAGVTATGSFKGKPSFCVTPFGQSLFS